MPPYYELAVVFFAHPAPPESRPAIAIVFAPATGHALLYQIVGSPADYTIDAPQSITLKEGEDGYLGRTPVGVVDSERVHQLHATLAAIPIVRGNPAWGSHSWVTEGVLALRKVDGYTIEKHVTPQWLSDRLGAK